MILVNHKQTRFPFGCFNEQLIMVQPRLFKMIVADYIVIVIRAWLTALA